MNSMTHWHLTAGPDQCTQAIVKVSTIGRGMVKCKDVGRQDLLAVHTFRCIPGHSLDFLDFSN